MHGYTVRGKREPVGATKGLRLESLEARLNLSAVTTLLQVPGLVAGAPLRVAASAPHLIPMSAGDPVRAARPTAGSVGDAPAATGLATPLRRYRYSGLAVTADGAKQQYFDTILRQRNGPTEPTDGPVTPGPTPVGPVIPVLPTKPTEHEAA